MNKQLFAAVVLGGLSVAALVGVAAPATAAPNDTVECYPYSFFASISGGAAKCYSYDEYVQNTIRGLSSMSASGSTSLP